MGLMMMMMMMMVSSCFFVIAGNDTRDGCIDVGVDDAPDGRSSVHQNDRDLDRYQSVQLDI
jgi:hypothetical protein